MSEYDRDEALIEEWLGYDKYNKDDDYIKVVRCINCVSHNHCPIEAKFFKVGIVNGYCPLGI